MQKGKHGVVASYTGRAALQWTIASSKTRLKASSKDGAKFKTARLSAQQFQSPCWKALTGEERLYYMDSTNHAAGNLHSKSASMPLQSANLHKLSCCCCFNFSSGRP
jgi:hypothetical protein